MRVLMIHPSLVAAVVDGTKTHTIRHTARCKPGDKLSLRCWKGAPYRSRVDVLADHVCTAVAPCEVYCDSVVIDGRAVDFEYSDPQAADFERTFASREGFSCVQLLLAFFGRTYGPGSLPIRGFLISWGPPWWRSHPAWNPDRDLVTQNQEG
jgi:hypothetical protein